MSSLSSRRALRCFVNGFEGTSRGFSVSAFLAPAAHIHQTRSRKPPRTPCSRNLTTSLKVAQEQAVQSITQGTRFTSQKLESEQSDSAFRNERKEYFLPLLDHFLPRNLQSAPRPLHEQTEEIGATIKLVRILVRARKSLPNGLLYTLAVEKGRWEAFLFLTKALIRFSVEQDAAAVKDSAQPLPQNALWAGFLNSPEIHLSGRLAQSFEIKKNDLTNGAVKAPSFPLSRPEMKTDLDTVIGQLLECLGRIIIHSGDDIKAMSYVHRVVAEMHSQNIVPQQMYDFDSNQVPFGRRKSPFLHAMSSRIMCVLSDSMWKAEEIEIIKKSIPMEDPTPEGRESDFSSPPIRDLGPAVWLELILWLCVHKGHNEPAARIVKILNSDSQWSFIRWMEIEKLAIQRSDIQHAKLTQTWFNKLAGSLEGYSEEPSLVEMPPKTLSAEVVANVVDGCLASYDFVKEQRDLVDNCLKAYRSTLPPQDYLASDPFWSAAMLRYSEITLKNPAESPLFLPEIGKNESRQPNQKLRNQLANEGFPCMTANPMHSFLVRLLDQAIENQDLVQALGALEYLRELASTKSASSDETHGDQLPNTVINQATSTSRLDISLPDTTLSGLINLLTSEEQYPVVQQLLGDLSDTDRTKPTQQFQAAVIHYALASSNEALLSRTLEQIPQDLSLVNTELIGAIFQAQVRLAKWERAVALLEYLSSDRRTAPGPKGVFIVAAEILRLRVSMLVEARTEKLRQAEALLGRMLSGEFLPKPSPGFPRDLPSARKLAQISRVLASVPGKLSDIAAQSNFDSENNNIGKSAYTVSIETNDFNTLLREVADWKGSRAARRLFAAWCRIGEGMGDPKAHVKQRDKLWREVGEYENGQLPPNIGSVRAVARAALKDKDSPNEETEDANTKPKIPGRILTAEQRDEMLTWAQETLGQMGYGTSKLGFE